MVKLTKLIDLLEDILLTDLNDSYLSQWIELNRKDITTTRVALIVDKIDTLVCSDKALDEKKCLLETYKKELEHININIDIQKLIYEIKSIIEHKSETNIINNIIIHIDNMSKNSEYKDDIIKIKKELSELNDNNKLAKLKYIDQLNKDLLEKFLHNEYGKKIAKNQNVGLELIDLLNEYRLSESLFEIVEDYVIDILTGKTIYKYKIKPLIFMALALIIIEEYSREGLYDRLPEKFNYLYDNFSKTKVDQIFRDASQYNSYKNDTDNCRLVTSVTANILVPRKYLVGFFEFIYDIYKYNFRFAIPENLEEDFHAIYASLKSKMLGIKDQIDTNIESGKSYKLLRGTQLIIKQERDIDSLIALSCLITKVIDLYFWEDTNFLKNTYIIYGLNKWSKNDEEIIKRDRHISKEKKPYSRLPEFIYRQGKVCLLPNKQNVMSSDDFSSIKIFITNGDKIIKHFDSPVINDIIGGYRVYIDGYIDLPNALGKLQYEIKSNNKVLYSSKNNLYRRSIVFKEDGTEFKNMTNYSGTIFICTSIDNKLCLSSKKVNLGDQLNINGDIYYFESLAEGTIYGNKLYNHTIKALETNRLYPVYKEIYTIYFPTTTESDRLNIIINGKNNRLSKFCHKIEQDGPYIKYAIQMNSLPSGIYDIKIVDLLDETRYREYHFAVDKAYEKPTVTLSNTNTKINIHFLSDLTALKDTVLYLSDFVVDWLKFDKLGHSYSYELPLDLPICRIDDTEWTLANQLELWAKDIKSDTTIEFYNTSQEYVFVSSNNNQFQAKWNLKRQRLINSLELRELKNYTDIKLINITAYYNGMVTIPCYYKCIVDKQATQIIPLNNNSIKIIPCYKGKGQMQCEVYLGHIKIASHRIRNNEPIVIENLRSLSTYRIKFLENTGALFKQNLEERTAFPFYHFFKKNFVNQMHPIKKVYYDVYYKRAKKWEEKCAVISNFYLNFLYLIDDVWIGEIFQEKNGFKKKLKHLSKIIIEEKGEYMENQFYVYPISETDDGLLYDIGKNIIIDGLEDKTAVDIIKFLIELKG